MNLKEHGSNALGKKIIFGMQKRHGWIIGIDTVYSLRLKMGKKKYTRTVNYRVKTQDTGTQIFLTEDMILEIE